MPCFSLAVTEGQTSIRTAEVRPYVHCFGRGTAPGPVLDFGPERGPGKGTMADLGPLIRHLVSTRLPSGGRAAFLSPLYPWTALDHASSLSRKLAYVPGPTFGFVKLLASSGSHCTKWADEQHRQAGFESRLVPDLPLPFIPTLIGLRAFDLVSSRVWWEAATNIRHECSTSWSRRWLDSSRVMPGLPSEPIWCKKKKTKLAMKIVHHWGPTLMHLGCMIEMQYFHCS